MNTATKVRIIGLSGYALCFGIMMGTLWYSSTEAYQCKEANRHIIKYERCIENEHCVLRYSDLQAYESALSRAATNCKED